MRLLAFGGNTSATRKVLGAWPLAENSRDRVLGSTVGVENEADVAFGIGLQGGSPFLILRTHEDAGPPRWYPYTILIDPGDDLWGHFRWNAGLVATALLAAKRSDDPRAIRFWRRPEELQAAELAEWLRGLPIPSLPEVRGAQLLQELIAATLARPTSLTMSVADLGFTSMPAPEAIAAALDGIDTNFRVGAGFLVGGEQDHGDYYGARLVLSAAGASARSSPPLEEVRESGRSFFRLWADVRARHPLAFERLGETPLWRWQQQASDVLDDLQLLAAPPSQLPVSRVFERLRASGKSRDAFFLALLGALLDSLASSGSTLGSQDSYETVSWILDTALPVEPRVYELLHFDGIEGALREHNIPPEAPPAHLSLPQHIAEQLIVRFLGESHGDGPSRARALLSYASDAGTSPRMPNRAVSSILLRVLEDAISANEPLAGWQDLLEMPIAASSGLRDRVKLEANRRYTDGTPNSWPIDALLFGDVSGAAEPDRDRLDTLARAALTIRDIPSAHRFLKRLGTDDIRRQLSFRVKREIASQLGRDSRYPEWALLCCLIDLLAGSPCEYHDPKPDRVSLESELIEALDHQASVDGRRQPAPLLADIAAVLGEVDSAALDLLQQLRPDLANNTATESWLRGWEALRHTIFEREVLRLLASGTDTTSIEHFLTPHIRTLSRSSLRDWLSATLARAVESDELRLVVRRLIRDLHPPTELRGALADVLNTDLAVRSEHRVSQTLAHLEPDTWDALLPLDDATAEARLGRLLLNSHDNIDESSHALFGRIKSARINHARGIVPGPFERLLFQALRAPEESRLRAAIARQGYRRATQALDNDLRMLLSSNSDV